jgi:predicted acylesterase/phospholipase RssA
VNGKNTAMGNDDFAERFGRERWLVVLHDPATKMPEGTRYWLRVFGYPRHLHLREDHLLDHARVMRTILGKGVGVVFGGGQARCFAQLGTIAAMKNLKILPDMIGGTSFGALLAAHIALEHDLDEIKTVHGALRKLKPFRALRWPGMTVSSDKKLDWLANNTFGSLHIEDFWLPYFCISTNLNTGAEVVHDRGQMTYAARATWAVSATPVIPNKEMLVDGSLVSNLPIDVMRRKTPGPIIAVDVSEASGDRRTLGAGFKGGFKGLAKWLSTKPREYQPVGSSTSLMRQQKAKQLQAESILLLHLSFARYGMTDFAAMEGLIELGYEQSLGPVKAFLG